MNLLFKEVDKDNWEECIELNVAPEQASLVATNWYSLLQAKFGDDCYPLCIYNENIMVGFLMYDIDPDTKRMEMSRLMIDETYQGNGYGKMAVLQLLDLIREKYGCIKFYTSIDPNNIMAEKLYEGVGFIKTGEIMWDEVVLMVQL
jgi:diamine N-acetyltransferase